MAKMGRPTKYDPAFCDDVVEYGKEGMGKVEMAVNLGIAHSTFVAWQGEHKDFSLAVKEALAQSQAWWERKGREATFGGVDGFQSTAYIFQMKNRFPNDWRDKREVDSTHNLADPLTELLGQVAQGGKRIGT
jgi:hypothetical protein